jgi:hypothetical protein
MNGKKTLIALLTAVGLGLVSVASAQAGTEKDDNDRGGIKVGPLGQPLGGPSTWGARGFPAAALAYGSYAYVPYHAHKRTHTRVR